MRKDADHYRPLFPDVPADLPYGWPPPAFPHWPLHRPGSAGLAALGVDDAAAVLGLTELRPEQSTALEVLRDGRDVVLATAEAVAATTGLLAGLCRPGPALWVRPQVGGRTDVTAPPLETLRPPTTVPAKSTLAASVARPPQPEDLASMSREVDGPVEFLFHRPEALAEPAVRAATVAAGAGLVVVEHAEALTPWQAGQVASALAALGRPPVLATTADPRQARRSAAALRLASVVRVAA